MSSHDRRAAARRRAWGRGPAILRFEPLEGRQLLSADLSPGLEPPTAIEVPAPTILPLNTAAGAHEALVPADAPPTEAAQAGTDLVITSVVETTAVAAGSDATTAAGAGTTPDAVLASQTEIASSASGSAKVDADPPQSATPPPADATASTPAPVAAPTVPAPAPEVPPPPDLVATAFDTLHRLDWGDPFHAVGAIRNQGGSAATAFRVDIVASPSAVVGTDEVLLGSVPFPDGLTAGESRPFDLPVALPAVPLLRPDAPPYLYVRLRVDAGGQVAEGDEANDVGRGQGLDASVVTIAPHLPARLVGASFNVSSSTLSWGDTVVVTTQVRNDAPGAAPVTRARIVLTPVGQLPGGTHDVTIGSLPVPALAAYESATVTEAITLPTTRPSTFAGVSRFYVWVLMDADFQISPLVARPAPQGLSLDAAAITIAPSRTRAVLPDLSAAEVRVSADTLTLGDEFVVSAGLGNDGRAETGPVRVRFLLTGPDGTTEPTVALGDATLPGLKAGDSRDFTQTLRLPSRLPEGLLPAGAIAGRIEVRVDPENAVDESDEADNSARSGPVVLKLLSLDGARTVVAPPPVSAPAVATLAAPAAPSAAISAPASVPLHPVAASPAPPAVAAADPAPAAAPTPPAAPSAGAGDAHRRRARRSRALAPKPKPRDHNLRLFPGGKAQPVRTTSRQKP
ncbi:MAG TPA: CARDB domain-containing protein [Isosphaeraceae bacterium]